MYVIPEAVCRRGRKPNYFWELPQSTVTLLEEGSLNLGVSTANITATLDEESGEIPVSELIESPITNLVVGDYVIVNFDGNNFVAVVKLITIESEGSIVMNFMRKNVQ